MRLCRCRQLLTERDEARADGYAAQSEALQRAVELDNMGEQAGSGVAEGWGGKSCKARRCSELWKWGHTSAAAAPPWARHGRVAPWHRREKK